MDDHVRRMGRRPTGIWLPECAYAPGLERLLDEHAVAHLMLDGPTLRHVRATTDEAWWLGDSDVAVVGRDLDVTYRVWSPRRGYPGGRWYRDFHTYHHESGFKLSRVTGSAVPPPDKAPYDPDGARRAVADDVDDFVATLMRRFADIEAASGSPGLVVAGYDTELFGHWWHEGVDWLEQLVMRLSTENVTVSTLAGALDRHPPAKPVYPERGSWGLGKGLDVWEGPAVAGMLDGQSWAQDALTREVAAARQKPGRDPWLDVLAEEVLLACASDWPFMVSHDSSPHYAQSRVDAHLAAVDHRLHHRSLTDDDPTRRPFGAVDARMCRPG
jgi:1,4-alpha-glucan branching enzyme